MPCFQEPRRAELTEATTLVGLRYEEVPSLALIVTAMVMNPTSLSVEENRAHFASIWSSPTPGGDILALRYHRDIQRPGTFVQVKSLLSTPSGPLIPIKHKVKSENGAILAKKEGNFPFLHLPTEIRNLIYHYVMIDNNAIHGTEAPSGRMIRSFCGSLCPWLQSLYRSRSDCSLRVAKARAHFQQIEEIIHNSPSSEFSYTTIYISSGWSA